MKTFRLLQRFLSFLDPYRSVLAGTTVLALLWTVINFIPPWLVKILVDDALPRQDLGLLNIIVFVEVVIVLNHQFMSAMKGFLFTYIEQRVYLDMNISLFDHLMTLPTPFFDKNDTGALVHRFMQDLMQIKELIGKCVIELTVNSVMFVLLSIILFFINVKLALICILLALVYGLNANVFKNRIYGTARDIGERTGELYGLLYQIIPGNRDIKALGLSQYMRAVYTKGLVRFFRAQIRNYRLGVYVSLIAETLPYLGWAVIIAVGGRQVINGSLSVGALLAFASYVDRIYQPINGLSGLYSECQKVVPAMERVLAVLDEAPEFNTFKGQRLRLEGVDGRLELNSVGFGYLKDRPVIKNVSLTIKPGSKVAIVGPSGCGKTTIAHLLMRFFDVSSGSIHLDGINLKQINIRDYRRYIGLIPQGVRLFGGTVLDNILMGNRRATEDEVVAASKAAHAHEFISRLPNGYSTVYGEKGVWLSGGEVQRVVIARAVLQNPKILILDEATSSVDAQSEYLIQNGLNALRVGRTVIAIAHRFSTIVDADQIAVMNDGAIVATGSHHDLIKTNAMYSQLYRQQIVDHTPFQEDLIASPA